MDTFLSVRFLYDTPIGALINKWRKKRVRHVVFQAEDDPTLEKDPIKASYVRTIPEAQIYRGVLLQGYLVPADVLAGLDKMEIREDDVFVITYPKSGTTWTEEIISLIYNDGDIRKVAKKLLIFRVFHLEVGRPFGQLRFLKGLKSPRLMASHLPLPLIPKQLRDAKCKIIYVVRNPKDTAVSYYHHHKMSSFLGNYSGTWDEFLTYFMKGYVVYGSWFDHVLPYWELCQQHPDKVFFMAYEEMKMDLRKMVRSLGDFLGKNLPESTVDTICSHCSFEEMKTNRMVNRENLPIPDLFDMSKSKFMRKGIIGDWKNYFTPEQSKLFDELYKTKTSESSLDLVFEPEQAIERMSTYGRVIYNHPIPEITKNALEDSLSKDSVCSNEISADDLPQPGISIPPMQMHLQPDPLIVDYLY